MTENRPVTVRGEFNIDSHSSGSPAMRLALQRQR